ncbi:hypothetical protein K443DRAFT_114964 [Laccaria amethystina LaAM-08-1]|uniref:Uncharacterized protein n=1 Tax=Laccaria amethystina LaAM-08-1 TaxID=1095629 RepID=A0A0C9X1K9_9AGAR|nr:hypothetical protein K443DRAFT_114964 [Laccaria amethystina LaAM-08-1]
MANLAVTYQNLGKYSEGEKLQIHAQEAQSRVFEEEHSHKIKTMPNVVGAQDTAVLDARSIVPEEETSDSRFSKFKIAHSFHKEKDLNDNFAGPST